MRHGHLDQSALMLTSTLKGGGKLGVGSVPWWFPQIAGIYDCTGLIPIGERCYPCFMHRKSALFAERPQFCIAYTARFGWSVWLAGEPDGSYVNQVLFAHASGTTNPEETRVPVDGWMCPLETPGLLNSIRVEKLADVYLRAMQTTAKGKGNTAEQIVHWKLKVK